MLVFGERLELQREVSKSSLKSNIDVSGMASEENGVRRSKG